MYLKKTYEVSVEKSCKVMTLSKSMWYYQSKKDDSEVMDRLPELAEALPTRGLMNTMEESASRLQMEQEKSTEDL